MSDESTLYFVAGAPRSNHSGQVIVYTLNAQKQLTIVDSGRGKQVVTSAVVMFLPRSVYVVCNCLLSQIGSYFGSVLCSLDVDKDGVTDLLLVGAPMFMNELRREEGRVHLFSVTKVRMGPVSASRRRPVFTTCTFSHLTHRRGS